MKDELLNRMELLSREEHKNLYWRCLGSLCESNCCHFFVKTPIGLSELEHLCVYFPVVFLEHQGLEEMYEMVIIHRLPEYSTRCIYLHPETGCKLGGLKPLFCKSYPFIPLKLEDGNLAFNIDRSCPGFNSYDGMKIFNDNDIDTNIKNEFIQPATLYAIELDRTREFVKKLRDKGLIRNKTFKYKDASIDIYCVDEKELLSLDKGDLYELHELGYIKYIYYHLNSLANFTKLIDNVDGTKGGVIKI